ncbi:hypothetical protein MMC25_004051 [Agyrium rufum]|nr:hypothetical protein [Agyrium rufum]
MSLTSEFNSLRRRLAQALLMQHALNPQVAEPCVNIVSKSFEGDYQFSFELESSLAHSFAFLAYNIHDSKRIAAAYVVEGTDKESMTIYLSSNRGSMHDVVNGFQRLGRILEQAARGGKPTEEDHQDFLEEVIKLDHPRILSRFCISHFQEKFRPGKQKKISPLVILEAWSRSSSAQRLTTKRQGIREYISTAMARLFAMQKALMKLKPHELVKYQHILKDLLKEVYNFLRSSHSVEFFAVMKSSGVDEASMKALTHRLDKIGWYYSISLKMVTLVHKSAYSCFRKVLVAPVKIKGAMVEMSILRTLSLSSTIQSIWQSQGVTEDSSAALLSSYCKRPQRLLRASEDFQTHTREARNTWKVHAEIQLLADLEIRPGPRRPRVIASSKRACYTCNLFFSLHGKYHIHETHNKLYDKWNLPDVESSLGIEDRKAYFILIEKLVQTLEQIVLSTLKGEKESFAQADESSVPLPLYMTPSTSSFGSRLGAPVGSVLGMGHKGRTPVVSVSIIEGRKKNAIPQSSATNNLVATEPTEISSEAIISFNESTDTMLTASATSTLRPSILAKSQPATDGPREPESIGYTITEPQEHESYESLSNISSSSSSTVLAPNLGSQAMPDASDPNTHTTWYSLTPTAEGKSHHVSPALVFDFSVEAGNAFADCWVRVRHQATHFESLAGSLPPVDAGLDIHDIATLSEMTASAGAALSDKELLVRYGSDIVAIKFCTRGPDTAIPIT